MILSRVSCRNKRLLIVLPLLLLLGWSLLAAAKAGLSDVYAFQVRSYIDKWRADDEPIDTKEWAVVSGTIDRLLWLVPDHPDYLGLAGMVHGLYAVKGPKGEVRSVEASRAEQYYRKAIAMRPGWPYTWANLLLIKAQQGRLDEEFYLAMERAATLGTWEYDVQWAIADAGMSRWDALNVVAKGRVVAAINRGISRNSAANSAYQTLAVQYQKRETLCAFLPRSEHQQRFCN